MNTQHTFETLRTNPDAAAILRGMTKKELAPITKEAGVDSTLLKDEIVTRIIGRIRESRLIRAGFGESKPLPLASDFRK